MAGNDYLQRVVVQGVSDGALRFRMTDGFSDLLVCPCFAVGNVPDGLEYLYLKIRARNLDGHAEFLQFAREVEVQFLYCGAVSLYCGALQCGILFCGGVGAGFYRARDDC